MSDTRILVLLGSLRTDSVNRRLAESVASLAPAGVDVTVHEGLGDVPFYNEDVDVPGAVPAQAEALRSAAGEADALLVVTPEYNGTMPAVLKNAIDWLSRPFGAGALREKPTAVIGGAHGQYGGVWAHDEARRSLGVAGARVLADAKLDIAGAVERFAQTAPHADGETAARVTEIVDALRAAAAESVRV